VLQFSAMGATIAWPARPCKALNQSRPETEVPAKH